MPATDTSPRAIASRGRTSWPLERVLFALAGTMTLLSALLAATVSPWFLLVSAFVGINQWLYVRRLGLQRDRLVDRLLREIRQGRCTDVLSVHENAACHGVSEDRGRHRPVLGNLVVVLVTRSRPVAQIGRPDLTAEDHALAENVRERPVRDDVSFELAQKRSATHAVTNL